MSKWIARLKDIKNTVPDGKDTYFQATNAATHNPVEDSTGAIYPTPCSICVPDEIKVSDSLPDTFLRENARNDVPDGSNLPYREVSGKHPTQPDTLEGSHQGVTIPTLPDTLPRLFALERLVSAASSNLLSGFTFDGVGDINRYVLAWGCAYLVGDHVEARARLDQVQIAREASS